MFRVGILGSENSHAMAFSKIFNKIDDRYVGEFDDITVVGTFGTDDASNKALVEQANVQFIADKPEDLLGHVDAVLVTARDGRYHAAYARPFIEAGLPAFVDKPFTSDPEEALALVRLAKKKQVPLCGGSDLKVCMHTQQLAAYAAAHRDEILTGTVFAPISMSNAYGNFWFYADHLAEISLSVFGWNPKWVQAYGSNEKGITAIAGYDAYTVSNHFCESMYKFSGTVVTQSGIRTQMIADDDGYPNLCRVFARMLRTGKMHETYEQLIRPIYYLDAIHRSWQTGEKIYVKPVVFNE